MDEPQAPVVPGDTIDMTPPDAGPGVPDGEDLALFRQASGDAAADGGEPEKPAAAPAAAPEPDKALYEKMLQREGRIHQLREQVEADRRALENERQVVDAARTVMELAERDPDAFLERLGGRKPRPQEDVEGLLDDPYDRRLRAQQAEIEQLKKMVADATGRAEEVKKTHQESEQQRAYQAELDHHRRSVASVVESAEGLDVLKELAQDGPGILDNIIGVAIKESERAQKLGEAPPSFFDIASQQEAHWTKVYDGAFTRLAKIPKMREAMQRALGAKAPAAQPAQPANGKGARRPAPSLAPDLDGDTRSSKARPMTEQERLEEAAKIIRAAARDNQTD